MKKNILLYLLVFSAYNTYAQFLYVGAGVGGSKMDLQLNTGGQYKKWYFANAENEVIEIVDIVTDKTMKITGSVFANFISKHNFMIRTDMQFFYNVSDVQYKNSVDTVTYLNAYKGIVGHQSMRFRYLFMSNSLDVGYYFLPTKVVRPYLYAGIGALTCLNIVQDGNYFDDLRNDRNSYIRREIVSFRRLSGKFNAGAGLRYHSISLEGYLSGNLGTIDFVSKPEDRTYKSYLMYGFTVKYDMLAINLSSKNIKLKVKELGQY